MTGRNTNENSSTFSRRMNIELPREIQVEGMDAGLQTRIWNTLHTFYIGKRSNEPLNEHYRSIHQEKTLALIYDSFFKESVDVDLSVVHVKDKFLNLKWNKVYDFVEFMLDNAVPRLKGIQDHLNNVLEVESAGYRIINNVVTPITNQIEITEIEHATKTYASEINDHINTALQMLSDKENPNPRNSIKESISAVEALLKKIGGDDKAVLDSALKKIKRKNPKLIDPKLENIIQKLWDFSNDASGIRHASVEGKTVASADDARFMLVICSSIVNYLIVKDGDS